MMKMMETGKSLWNYHAEAFDRKTAHKKDIRNGKGGWSYQIISFKTWTVLHMEAIYNPWKEKKKRFKVFHSPHIKK